jgi:hypothetical protein
MRIRLNGWQRIGIVLSVIWAIGGGIWGNNLGIHEGDWVIRRLEYCLARETDPAPCHAEFDKYYPRAIATHWASAAIVGLVPIPLVWLMIYGLIGLWRWIRRGFT